MIFKKYTHYKTLGYKYPLLGLNETKIHPMGIARLLRNYLVHYLFFMNSDKQYHKTVTVKQSISVPSLSTSNSFFIRE